MIRNLNIMNLILFILIVLLGITLYRGYAAIGSIGIEKLAIPKDDAAKEKPRRDILTLKNIQQIKNVSEYSIISKKNLFHPERKFVVVKNEEKPEHKPEFVLFGTLITGDTSLAFLEDLKSQYMTAGKGKRQRVLRLGATLSGYTLKEIYNDRVVLVKGDDRIEVKVINPNRKVTAPTKTVKKPLLRRPAVRNQPKQTVNKTTAPPETRKPTAEEEKPTTPELPTVLGVRRENK